MCHPCSSRRCKENEELKDFFFKKLVKTSVERNKKVATNPLKNPGRTLEIGAKIGSVAVFKSPEAALSFFSSCYNFL